MSSSGYTPWAVTLGEQPTTAYWNILGSNDASFNNGHGINDGAILTRHLANNAVTSPAISTGAVDANAIDGQVALWGSGSRLVNGSNDPGTDKGMFLMQSATAVTDGNYNGDSTVFFPKAFPNGVVCVTLSQGDTTEAYFKAIWGVTTTRFNVRYSGGGLVRTNYIAIGW